MNRRVGSLLVGCVCALISGAGCRSQQTGISQLSPYVGSRPGPIARLPRVRPKVSRATRPGPQQGWIPPKNVSSRWKYVVIHHSGSDASTPRGMRDWHVNGRGWSALGYHFVIGNGVGYGDGEVYVGERWTRQMHGAHCKTPDNRYNDRGVGVCLIGDLETHGPTPRQVRALTRLVSFLSEKCGIPKSRILTHGGVTNKTACPGRHFSLKPVFRRMSLGSVSASSK